MGLPELSVVIDTRDHMMESAGLSLENKGPPSGRYRGMETPEAPLIKIVANGSKKKTVSPSKTIY
jgi:hypothetical protein